MKIEEIKKERPILTEGQNAEIKKIISYYPEGKQKSAILRVLHIVQRAAGGWLSTDAMDMAAEILDITPIEVYEVATFYTMYNLKPVGKYVLEVCDTGPCMIEGSGEIIKHIEKTLGIKDGETTPDGMFTLKVVQCLGACGYAPMLQCGRYYHEHLTTIKVDELIAACRKGEVKTF